MMEDDSDFSQVGESLWGELVACCTSILHLAFFAFLVSNQEEAYVCAEMVIAIFLSHLTVTWLIVPKQLDKAIAIFNDSV